MAGDYASDRAHVIFAFDQLRQLLVDSSPKAKPIDLMFDLGFTQPKVYWTGPFDPEECGIDTQNQRFQNLSNCAGPGGGHGG